VVVVVVVVVIVVPAVVVVVVEVGVVTALGSIESVLPQCDLTPNPRVQWTVTPDCWPQAGTGKWM
ncbi:hypothetical protein ElyMa_005558000, partial [Elysia marginata]